MKKKIVWLTLSGVMVAALLLASCAPAVTEEEEKAAPPPKEEKEVVTEEKVVPPPEEPIYGAVLNHAINSPAYSFDECYGLPFAVPLRLTHEDLFTGDWSKGPAGTGEVSWRVAPFMASVEIGCLAESWEMPDEETAVFHIRKGVHFHDKPPVNGREMTAEDVAFTIKRVYLSDLPFSFKTRAPTAVNIRSVEVTDKWTVVVKSPPGYIAQRVQDMYEIMRIVAPEAGGEYPGDYRHWETCIGTGPFMVVDEVPSSSLTFVRNPNYWRKDPVHPENTLPYLDGVNFLIIPDASTRLAALRTGKIAMLSRLSWEDKDSLVKTNPELKWVGGISGAEIIGMRVDKPELPFHDIRVRQALAMAIDRQAIAKDYYGGNAEVFAWPILPIKEFEDMFTPLDELPESIQELYEYNPEKTRQLLAEAGYPNGFKTEIICTQNHVDLLSIPKAYWADIGVDVELEVKEMGAYRGMSHTHEGMYIGGGFHGDPAILMPFVTAQLGNISMVSDPYLDDLFHSKVEKLALVWSETCGVMKEEVVPYALEHCWYIDLPSPTTYTFWQPWLKGYHGELNIGLHNSNAWLIYVWLDQELKKEMTGD